MRYLLCLAVLVIGFLGAAVSAEASVVAQVNVSTQRMTVYVDGVAAYDWSVSTARRGYATPRGTFRPQQLFTHYYSKKYHNSPMPHSIFFAEGYAVHGTNALGQLGTPASHGCIRLHPHNASLLFQLVRQHGLSNSRIDITG